MLGQTITISFQLEKPLHVKDDFFCVSMILKNDNAKPVSLNYNKIKLYLTENDIVMHRPSCDTIIVEGDYIVYEKVEAKRNGWLTIKGNSTITVSLMTTQFSGYPFKVGKTYQLHCSYFNTGKCRDKRIIVNSQPLEFNVLE